MGVPSGVHSFRMNDEIAVTISKNHSFGEWLLDSLNGTSTLYSPFLGFFLKHELLRRESFRSFTRTGFLLLFHTT